MPRYPQARNQPQISPWLLSLPTRGSSKSPPSSLSEWICEAVLTRRTSQADSWAKSSLLTNTSRHSFHQITSLLLPWVPHLPRHPPSFGWGSRDPNAHQFPAICALRPRPKACPPCPSSRLQASVVDSVHHIFADSPRQLWLPSACPVFSDTVAPGGHLRP